VRFLARHPQILCYQDAYEIHRGKITRFALAMKAKGMPLPNPPVDGANDFSLPLSADLNIFTFHL
jgi:hypothetical protein